MNEQIRNGVRDAMAREGLSQGELAREMGVGRVNLNRSLKGRNGKIPALWQRLLDRFGLELIVRQKS